MGIKARKVGGSTRLRYRVLLMGPDLDQKGGMASVQKLILKEVPATFDPQHISTHDEGSMLHRIQIFLVGTAALLGKLMRNRCDLVHLHVSEKGSVLRKILLLWLVKAFRKPVIMHTHGCEFPQFHQSLPGWARSLTNVSLRQADCFITLSDGWRQYYITHCHLKSSRVVTLPNPVEMPPTVVDRSARTAKDASSTASTVKFVFLGRIGQRKGAFDLIRAFAVLPNRENARLWLAGDGEIGAAKALIDELDLSGAVRLLGWIDETQRSRLLSEADVFVLPSYHEALPMAMLEAMAAALPVISTPVGGIPEFMTEGVEGCLVEPGDVGALSRAMARLAESGARRQQMGQQGRDRVRSLDIHRYGDLLATLYRSLLDGSFATNPPRNGSAGQSASQEVTAFNQVESGERSLQLAASRLPGREGS